jgi:streptogramin lyase
MRKSFLSFTLLLASCAWVCGCDNTADKQIQEKQEQMQQQQMAQTGLPGITNFTEAKLVKHLYELRDQKILTYSYIPDMNGKLWHLCDSIGYGLPYGVQFSNPEKATARTYPMPQSEPNGLFMPTTAEGTWVTCINPNNPADIAPVYVEPRVIVSPFKLKAEGDYALKP